VDKDDQVLYDKELKEGLGLIKPIQTESPLRISTNQPFKRHQASTCATSTKSSKSSSSSLFMKPRQSLGSKITTPILDKKQHPGLNTSDSPTEFVRIGESDLKILEGHIRLQLSESFISSSKQS
jgi:hypothetical protein